MPNTTPQWPATEPAFALSRSECALLARLVVPLIEDAPPELRQGFSMPRGSGLDIPPDLLERLCEAADLAADLATDPAVAEELSSIVAKLDDALAKAGHVDDAIDELGEALANSGLDPDDPGAIWLVELLLTDWYAGTDHFWLDELLDAGDVGAPPFVRNCRELILLARETGGVPLTQSGALKREAVQAMLERGHWRESDVVFLSARPVNESAVPDLRLVHATCKKAGLLRRHKHKLIITRYGRCQISDSCAGAILKDLFIAYFREVDVAAIDGGPEAADLRDTMLAYLYGLSLLPNDWRTASDLQQQIVPREACEPLPRRYDAARVVYERLVRPLVGFGLMEARPLGTGSLGGHFSNLEFRLTPLFYRFVNFATPPEVLALAEEPDDDV